MAESTCGVEGCPNSGRLKRGWCQTHYARWTRTGDPGGAEIFEFGKPRPPKACTIEGCTRRHKARGLCRTHYSRWRDHGDPKASEPIQQPLPGGTCAVDDCGELIFVKLRRLCKQHYHRWQATGTTHLRVRTVTTPEERKAAQREYVRRYQERRRAQGRTCSIDGCSGLAVARGWCGAHHRRYLRFGSPGGEPIRRDRGVRICAVDGCTDPVQSRGYCCRHYGRLRRYGDPLGGGPPPRRTKWLPQSATPEERFWAKVEKTDTCWLWTGGLNSDGYGVVCLRSGQRRPLAHRYAWQLAGRPLVPGMELDHRCRVRRCVRPAHLRQVTHVVNAAATRRTHCERGHPFDVANTVIRRDQKGRTHRSCRTCYNAWRRRRRASKKVSRVHADLAAQYRRAIADDTCRYCGGLAEHDDHYFPTSKGGRDFWWNLTRACGPCNRAKGSHCGTWFRLRTGSLTPT